MHPLLTMILLASVAELFGQDTILVDKTLRYAFEILDIEKHDKWFFSHFFLKKTSCNFQY